MEQLQADDVRSQRLTELCFLEALFRSDGGCTLAMHRQTFDELIGEISERFSLPEPAFALAIGYGDYVHKQVAWGNASRPDSTRDDFIRITDKGACQLEKLRQEFDDPCRRVA